MIYNDEYRIDRNKTQPDRVAGEITDEFAAFDSGKIDTARAAGVVEREGWTADELLERSPRVHGVVSILTQNLAICPRLANADSQILKELDGQLDQLAQQIVPELAKLKSELLGHSESTRDQLAALDRQTGGALTLQLAACLAPRIHQHLDLAIEPSAVEVRQLLRAMFC